MSSTNDIDERNRLLRRRGFGDESGIIVFGGGGGRGCVGRGCLFWIVLSVVLTVLANLVLVLFSGGGPEVGV